MKYFLSALSLLAISATANAQAVQTLPSGIEYKFLKDVPGTQYPAAGSFIEANLVTRLGEDGTILFDSRSMNDNKPVQFQVQPPQFKGDVIEGVMKMTAGDSAIFMISVDTLAKMGQQIPNAKMGEGQKLVYVVKLVSVKTAAEVEKEKKESSAKQVAIDEKVIQDYLKKKGIKAVKAPSGLYYKIEREGTGATVKAGEQATVNYSGHTLNDSTFDSNVDPAFQHVQPFSFNVAGHQVIAGWDEGVQLLKKGTKAVLFIPSGMAYGDRSPSPKIPANSVLVFDIEVTDVKTQEQVAAEQAKQEQAKTAGAGEQKAADDKLIQDYLKKNNIKATKTATGLYYKLDKPGTGENAKAGQKVTVNYTGTTMNGEKFDSNVDPAFNHVSPFTFNLASHQVIAGWDEGVQLMKKGSKGTLYIPSAMAYGERSPTAKIPANSVLVFDIEVTGVE
jgi:FKBP-type peptidyl-prolyl cis-trans isomerase FkpA